MDSSTSKTEVMKPSFLKAGIPLAVSVAGFVCARIIARRSVVAEPSKMETKVIPPETNGSHEEIGVEESTHSRNSTSSLIEENEEHMNETSQFSTSIESSGIREEEISVEEEVLFLRNKIDELEKREWDLEAEFLRYRVMKEHEFVLMELRNVLLLETARVEFLDREISLMEAEKQRFENLVVEYLEVLEQLEFVELENGLLQRKAKRLSRKIKEQALLLREKNLKIEDREAEILRCCGVLETRTNIIKQQEDELREFKDIVHQLQEEKNELLIKLNLAEISSPSIEKTEAQGMTMEDYNRLAKELDQVQNDRAAEVTELTYLRWTNACLRHEMMRSKEQQHRQQQEQQVEAERKYLELELVGNGEMIGSASDPQQYGSVLVHDEPCLRVADGSQTCSKRKKFLQKLKRWVEGSETMKSNLDEKDKKESKCIGRLSVSGEAGQDNHGRWSYSSA